MIMISFLLFFILLILFMTAVECVDGAVDGYFIVNYFTLLYRNITAYITYFLVKQQNY